MGHVGGRWRWRSLMLLPLTVVPSRLLSSPHCQLNGLLDMPSYVAIVLHTTRSINTVLSAKILALVSSLAQSFNI